MPGTLGLILGVIGTAVLFLCWCRKRNSQHRMENKLQKKGEVCETQKDTEMNSQNTKDKKIAKLDSLALEIEVDHAADNVSAIQDFEPPSEEIFDDKTVGFSTIEFCTVYKNNLYGNDMHTKRKSCSTEKSNERDVESAYIGEIPVEGCTPITAKSQLCESSTDDSKTDTSNRVDDVAFADKRVESSPPQFSDFTGRIEEGRVANALPETESNFRSYKSQVIVHAPPGELGLTIIGNTNSGQVQVNRVKLLSPLRSFIQEGDVLESINGESIAGLTSTQVSSLISSGANSSTRVLVFVRNYDGSSNPMVEQSIEGVKVLVYAPPGELGLTIIGDTINGNLIVRSIKSFSPLYGKIQEGDVIISVEGEPTKELTAPQVFGLITSRASNPLRALVFDRNKESKKFGDISL
jgi:hypothetical protein